MLSKDEIDALIGPGGNFIGDKIKILIVEDSPNINLLYHRGLPDGIFEKRFVANGHDALVSYNEWQPDIIILDIMLPVMTGYSVLKEIRGKFHDMSTTIIMSTSLNKKEDVTLMMKQGIQGYIVKPFSVREIGERILRYYEKIDHDRASAAIIACQRYLEEMARAAFKSETPAKEPPLKEPVEKKEEKAEEKKEEDQNASDKKESAGEKKE
jgi:DNA-binding response OmpR family regulator